MTKQDRQLPQNVEQLASKIRRSLPQLRKSTEGKWGSSVVSSEAQEWRTPWPEQPAAAETVAGGPSESRYGGRLGRGDHRRASAEGGGRHD